MRNNGVASQKFRGGAKLYWLVQRRTQDSVKGATTGGLGAEPLAATDFVFFYKKSTHFSVVFLSRKNTRVGSRVVLIRPCLRC